MPGCSEVLGMTVGCVEMERWQYRQKGGAQAGDPWSREQPMASRQVEVGGREHRCKPDSIADAKGGVTDGGQTGTQCSFK